jgi:hypothetical protein
MSLNLQLHSSLLTDLAEVRDTPIETLNAIIWRLSRDSSPRFMPPKKLRDNIVSVFGPDRIDAARRVTDAVITLQTISRQQGLAADALLEIIRTSLSKSDSRWSAEELVRWQAVEKVFGQLFSHPAVRVVAIALDLMYGQEDFTLHNTRIVTAVHPVFGEDGESVVGAVVTHTLQLQHSDSAGAHNNINLAMGEVDLRKLETQCKQALQRSQAVCTVMQENAKVPTMVAGDTAVV